MLGRIGLLAWLQTSRCAITSVIEMIILLLYKLNQLLGCFRERETMLVKILLYFLIIEESLLLLALSIEETEQAAQDIFIAGIVL